MFPYQVVHHHVVPTAVVQYPVYYPHPTQMMRLDPSQMIYQEVASYFIDKWHHPNKEAQLEAIYLKADYAQSPIFVPPGWSLLFHGTRRACKIAECDHRLGVCDDPECSVCRIIEGGFDLKKSDSKGMFGKGIYTTSISSKADGYAKNHRIRSKRHAILLCLVYVGIAEPMYRADHKKRAPIPGCDSVMGMIDIHGGSLEYPETVVYDKAQAIPIGLIMYSREGWKN